MPCRRKDYGGLCRLTDGQLNLAYFELIAGIYNLSGEQVGLCTVLIPDDSPTRFGRFVV
jgi:hypothetical protein